MGVNIDMSGVKVTGEAKMLNGMSVRGNGNVDINLKKTKLTGKSEILNDIDTKDMNLNINMEETEIGEDVKFMNGEEVSKYKSNNRSEPQRTKETIQRAYNAPQKVVESNKEQQTKKKSLLRSRLYKNTFCVAKCLLGSAPTPFVLHFSMQAARPGGTLLRMSIGTSYEKSSSFLA